MLEKLKEELVQLHLELPKEQPGDVDRRQCQRPRP